MMKKGKNCLRRKGIKTLFTLLFTPTMLFAQTWNQVGPDIDGESGNDWSGSAVALDADGNTIVVGARENDANLGNVNFNYGHIRIYEWNGSLWTQKGDDIDGEAVGDQFGTSVAISADGNTIVAGAAFNDGNGSNAGRVRAFEWNGSAWIQKGLNIDGVNAGDRNGQSVSLSADGNTLAVGAPFNSDSASSSGQARVFDWNGSAWVQKGTSLNGDAVSNWFGWSIALSTDGNTLVAGAPMSDGIGSNSGETKIYEWDGSAWLQRGIAIDGEAADDFSGVSVAVDASGDVVAIGARGNDDAGSNSGHVRIYEWNGISWLQKGGDIDGEAAQDFSGETSLSGDGNTVIVGASRNDGNGSDAGHSRVFQWNGSVWNQLGQDLDGDSNNDESGFDVTISSDGARIAVGAIKPGGVAFARNASFAGYVRVYDMSTCANTFGTDVQIACGNFTWIDGNTYTASNDTATFIVANSSGCDSVVTLDLTLLNSSVATDVQTACESYTWIDGNVYTSSNNTATFNLTNAAGCDSVVTLDLTINAVSDLTTSVNGLTITANNNNGTYQWIDCDNNDAPLANETGQSFTVTTNGNYAVIITENGCSDTSACVNMSTVSIDESDNALQVLLYPNPTRGNVQVQFPDVLQRVSIEVTDARGKLISRKNFGAIENVVIQLGESRGVYFIHINSDSKRITRKLIKR